MREFKGEDYVFGVGCFDRMGSLGSAYGKRVSVVAGGIGREWGKALHESIRLSLSGADVELAGEIIPSSKPNSPREDVFRICSMIGEQAPDAVVAVSGGSGIDATKAAIAYLALKDSNPDFDSYFGVGRVKEMLACTGTRLLPLVAVQTASGSGAHLTRYSNITDMSACQKLLIIDDAVVAPKALFDYELTATMPRDFTMDGALDGVAHCLEVLYGTTGDALEKAREPCLLGIDLIVGALGRACEFPADLEARECIGLGTDLGGYAIMIGGTNGAHLTSFSMVDLLPHGRACALMNPYYTVFFAPRIEEKLRAVGAIYIDAGFISTNLDKLSGCELGQAVAEGMIAHSRALGFPTCLNEVDGFSDAHIERALAAAKNPKLESKLKNMPVPLSADTVDDFMGPVLRAAKTGDFGLIRSME